MNYSKELHELIQKGIARRRQLSVAVRKALNQTPAQLVSGDLRGRPYVRTKFTNNRTKYTFVNGVQVLLYINPKF